MKIMFIGDIVGNAGLAYLEQHLPSLKTQHQPDFIVANGENLAENASGAGLTKNAVERLLALGVHAITGGNHSWDGAEGRTVHENPLVLRPLNRGSNWAGRGAIVLEQAGLKLGLINISGRIPTACITSTWRRRTRISGWRRSQWFKPAPTPAVCQLP